MARFHLLFSVSGMVTKLSGDAHPVLTIHTHFFFTAELRPTAQRMKHTMTLPEEVKGSKKGK